MYHNAEARSRTRTAGESRRRLGIDAYDTANDDDLATAIEFAAGRESSTDQRVTSAIARWSVCMKAARYHYGHLSDPARTAFASTPIEIRTTLADVCCKHQIDLVGVWSSVEVAYENALIAKNRPKLTALVALRDTMVRAAAA